MPGYVVKSRTLPKYQGWLSSATQAEIEKIDKIYLAAEKFPNTHGKHVINSLIPSELIEQMTDLNTIYSLSFFQVPQYN